MNDFSELKGRNPFWLQPKAMGRRYELRHADNLYASLEFRSAFGSFATAEYSGGKFTFKRVGFFSPHVTVRREGDEDDFAVFRPNWTGAQGLLEIDGQQLSWRPSNFWATRYAWYQGKETLVFYRQGSEEKKLSDVFKTQAKVEIADPAWRLPDLPLLVTLGWYLIVLYEQDSTAVIAATAGTAS